MRRSIRKPTLILTAFLLALPSLAQSNEPGVLVVPLPAPGGNEWLPLSFPGLERETLYTSEPGPDGRPAVRAASDCGASALVLELPGDFDLSRTPRLAWRWRIERGLRIGGERTKKADDFAARIYILFRFDPTRASFWRRLQQGIARRFFGREIPGQTLNYVWSNSVPIGQHWPSPYHEDARIIALESESAKPSSGAWREARVDLVADAARLFDPPPRLQPYALGLMTDSDNVCGQAIAWFSDFRLLGPEPSGPATAYTGSR